MLEDNFWQDKLKSQKIIKEKKLFEDLINSHQNSVGQINDLDDLYQLALEENNSEIQNEVSQNISNLRTVAKQNEIKCFYPMKQIR
jgi:peptide chain release factor 2